MLVDLSLLLIQLLALMIVDATICIHVRLLACQVLILFVDSGLFFCSDTSSALTITSTSVPIAVVMIVVAIVVAIVVVAPIFVIPIVVPIFGFPIVVLIPIVFGYPFAVIPVTVAPIAIVRLISVGP